MPRKKTRLPFKLPEHVQPVISRGKTYYYFQKGRGTTNAGPRVRLPDNPQLPEFWVEYQHLLGGAVVLSPETVNASIDQWIMDLRMTQSVTLSTIGFYEDAAKRARTAWGALSPRGLKPVHIETVLRGLASKPGAANNFLATMRAFGRWAKKRDIVSADLTEGLRPIKRDTGHKPWTPKQMAVAKARLTGSVRRGVILYMYTGLRGSDVVRLGPEHIDEGGFAIKTQKRKREVYCPILPELGEEMETWVHGEGPFLRQEGGRADGHPYTRKLFSKHFAEQRDQIPELAEVTLHGLRATAVGRLRAGGVSAAQIGDIVGMSIAMVERYSRFIDRKASAKAGIQTMLLNEQRQQFVKRPNNEKHERKNIKKIGRIR